MVRQDAWNQDEDLLLAEVVLRHIREGGTQLAAFEEVGEKLSRTPAACGFRWNSSIRKKYESAIQLAKKQRKHVKKEEYLPTSDDKLVVSKKLNGAKDETTVLKTVDEMVQFLLSKKEELVVSQQKANGVASGKDYDELLEENKRLEEELTRLRHEYEIIKNDYQLMINVMERATKRNQLSVK
ncbi:RsfA family transcriptional regulator [Evansella sp. AB-P1]|uniref:RsfA family transcriptional regulator n=1 Tax=Evansella sp. AB-P1 TaxID=3037653 RepID=UPI00241EAC98|nr:RsfA family transcriptional regulator [Evansella sp. AB-P1]MDG5788302.1 RsfA family transcriptional regulator [Evansella sp. AB-P1]